MHFNFDISLGNVLTILTMAGIGWRALMYLRQLDRIIWEHELMWKEYADTHDIPSVPAKVWRKRTS